MQLKNRKQELFCQQYVIDYNATQAAKRAGYSEKTAYSQACDLLKKPDILARVRELQHEQTERLAMSQDWVVQNLADTCRRCMQSAPVLDNEGNETGEYVFDSRGALRALELLGKHMGMFGDKLALSAKVDTGQLGAVLAQLGGGADDG